MKDAFVPWYRAGLLSPIPLGVFVFFFNYLLYPKYSSQLWKRKAHEIKSQEQ